MNRFCAWAAPGNDWKRRQRAPRGGNRQNATPVRAIAGARVILSQWAWYASQRALVATGEAANG